MKKGVLAVGFAALVSAWSAVSGQSPAAPQTPATATLPAAAAPVSADRAVVNQYCIGCHNQRLKTEAARKLPLDQLDVDHVRDNPEAWERVVRKLRAGMMPPANARRPDPATYARFITHLETELDSGVAPFTPPPGLHRLNRTEYANVVRDLLDLEIDPAKYLPSDDSTHGFDNIAGALGISSTLVEAYVGAAGKISRLAIGEAEPATLVVYRTPEDTSQDYHVEGLPFGTRGGMLVRHPFPSDGEYTVTVTPIFGDNMSPAGFGSVPCEKIEVVLDGERLQLIDWQGSRRLGAPTDSCGGARGGRGRGAAPAAGGGRGAAAAGAAAGPAGGGQQGPEAFFGGRGGTPMRVRFKTTAGMHAVGVAFPATNFAPVLDLDQHFMRDTLQTGPTPGFTFFPHVGTVRIEGPFNATPAKDSTSRRKTATSITRSKWCSRASWRRPNSSTASKPSRRARRPVRRIASAISTWRRASRSSCGARCPTIVCSKSRIRASSRIRRCSRAKCAAC